VKAFERPREGSAEEAEIVFRISLWVTGVHPALALVYELHPEASAGPVPRPAVGRRIRRDESGAGASDDGDHLQWINTVIDYEIRLRTSDRREWGGYRVAQALTRHYGAHHWDQQIPKAKRTTSSDDDYKDAGTMSAREALAALCIQTFLFRARAKEESDCSKLATTK
jgi:hypothetical protein